MQAQQLCQYQSYVELLDIGLRLAAENHRLINVAAPASTIYHKRLPNGRHVCNDSCFSRWCWNYYLTYMLLRQQFCVFEFLYLTLSHVSTAQITSPAQLPAPKCMTEPGHISAVT